MPEQQNVLVNAGIGTGEFKWQTAYGVLKDEQSVITFWGNGGSECNMLVARGRMSSLFFVNEKGDIAKANVDPLNTMSEKEERVHLDCEILNQPKNIADLRLSAKR